MRRSISHNVAFVVGALLLLQAVVGGSCLCEPVSTAEASQHACCRAEATPAPEPATCCTARPDSDTVAACDERPCACLHAPAQPADRPAAPGLVRGDESTAPAALPASELNARPAPAAAALHESEPLALLLFVPQWATSRCPPLL
jgi:hypothetical protein